MGALPGLRARRRDGGAGRCGRQRRRRAGLQRLRRRRRRLVTPAAGVLEGISRRTVIELARAAGLAGAQAPLPVADAAARRRGVSQQHRRRRDRHQPRRRRAGGGRAAGELRPGHAAAASRPTGDCTRTRATSRLWTTVDSRQSWRVNEGSPQMYRTLLVPLAGCRHAGRLRERARTAQRRRDRPARRLQELAQVPVGRPAARCQAGARDLHEPDRRGRQRCHRLRQRHGVRDGELRRQGQPRRQRWPPAPTASSSRAICCACS